jgi:hypothetical protein
MKFLIPLLLLASTTALAAQPEVFINSAVITPDAETLIVRVSYCGDQGNFQFDLKPCMSLRTSTDEAEARAVRCYEVTPKLNYAESCRRVIDRTETFDFRSLGDSVPPAESLIQLRGSRETLVEVYSPKH